MAAQPERWAVDAGTRDVARLDIPADALHELSGSDNPQGKEYEIGAELVLGDSSGPAPLEQPV